MPILSDLSLAYAGAAIATAERRVILSMSGKGGVGKTSVMAGLAEWSDENQITVTILDLDTENKARGSLTISSEAGYRRSTSTHRQASTLSSITWQMGLASSSPTWAQARVRLLMNGSRKCIPTFQMQG